MFTAIAGVYDLNNTLLSFGLHYRWTRLTAAYVPAVMNGRALDIGAGTADLALLIESKMGENGHVVASDLNHAMLAEGTDVSAIDRVIPAGPSARRIDHSASRFRPDGVKRLSTVR